MACLLARAQRENLARPRAEIDADERRVGAVQVVSSQKTPSGARGLVVFVSKVEEAQDDAWEVLLDGPRIDDQLVVPLDARVELRLQRLTRVRRGEAAVPAVAVHGQALKMADGRAAGDASAAVPGAATASACHAVSVSVVRAEDLYERGVEHQPPRVLVQHAHVLVDHRRRPLKVVVATPGLERAREPGPAAVDVGEAIELSQEDAIQGARVERVRACVMANERTVKGR